MNQRPFSLYRLFFGERTILFEGYLAFAGLVAWVVGRTVGIAWLTQAGFWMSVPFAATLLIALLVLAPWFWWRGRGTRVGDR